MSRGWLRARRYPPRVGGSGLFRHTFTAADSAVAIPSADTGESTQVLAGTWGISSNRAYLVTSTGSNNNAVVWNTGVSDGTFAVTFAVFNSAAGRRLVFRATDVDNLFIVDCSTLFTLYRRQAGAYTSMGTNAAVPATGDVISVVLLGTSITVKQNGTTIISTTSSFNQTATRHGIGDESVSLTRYDLLQRTA